LSVDPREEGGARSGKCGGVMVIDRSSRSADDPIRRQSSKEEPSDETERGEIQSVMRAQFNRKAIAVNGTRVQIRRRPVVVRRSREGQPVQ
jgi:hypothetical protein